MTTIREIEAWQELLITKIRELIEEYVNVLPVDAWIPMNERLPKEGQYVLLVFCGQVSACIAQDNNGTLREILWANLWLDSEPGNGHAVWTPFPGVERSSKKYTQGVYDGHITS